MATVTTTNSNNGLTATWNNPAARSSTRDNPYPIGKIVYESSFVVAAKGAADETEVIMSWTLPRNYYYRLGTTMFNIIAGDSASLLDFELMAGMTITENQVSRYQLTYTNQFALVNGSGSGRSFKARADAVTQDFLSPFLLTRVPDQLIDASQGSSVVTTRILDSSADTSLTVTFSFYCEAFMYTVEQARHMTVPMPALWNR